MTVSPGRVPRLQLFVLLTLLLTLVFSLNRAIAAPMPNFDKDVIINAREQPIDLFLGELFGQIGVPVKVEDGIMGTVNGDFRKSASAVFDDIAGSFHLMMYYDGAVVHVYPSRKLIRNILYMPENSARNIKRAVDKLAMGDSENLVEVSSVGLVVTGAEQFVQQIENLSNAMRKKPTRTSTSEAETYRIFKLRYAWADDVTLAIGGETVIVPGVASLLRSLIEPGSFGAPAATVRLPNSQGLEGLRGRGLQSVSTEANPGDSGAAINTQQSEGQVASGSTDRTRIVADPLSNSVIIRDQADRMSSYQSLIDSLDKEPQMIEIEATIIDLDTDRMRELGIDWRLERGDGVAVVGNPQTLQNNLLNPGGTGGVVSLVLGSQQQFISRIRALESQGVARIVSKPHVMTLSNVEALLDTTSTFFVRVEGQEEVDLFDVSVGTTLRVTPHVYEHGGGSQIKLRVNIQDGSRSDALSVDSIPSIDRSTINTQAIIDVGQSLLIGGLIRESTGNGVARVPVLGRIPGIGGLFRTRTKSSSRQERMFLITPRLSASSVTGKRFSAPILSGSEHDIIGTSPSRMSATRNALNRLDQTNPAALTLPRGDTLDTSNGSFQEPYSPVVPQRDNQTPPTSNQRRSLRERLLPQAQEDLIVINESQPDSTPLESDGQGKALFTNTPAFSTDGWQAVQPATTAVQIVNDEQSAEPARSSAPRTTLSEGPNTGRLAAPADDDGWQVISQ